MINRRDGPHETTFSSAVANVAEFLQFNNDQLALAIGTEGSEVSRWQMTLQELDRWYRISNTSFRFDGRLLQRRLLIARLNGLHEKLLERLGSETAIRSFLTKPWLDNAYATSLTDIAARKNTGLMSLCNELEEWLNSKSD